MFSEGLGLYLHGYDHVFLRAWITSERSERVIYEEEYMIVNMQILTQTFRKHEMFYLLHDYFSFWKKFFSHIEKVHVTIKYSSTVFNGYKQNH